MRTTQPNASTPQASRQAVVASYNHHYRKLGQLRETDAFYRWVLDCLEVQAPGPLLDMACGEGHLVKFARQRGVNAVGIDFSPSAIQWAQQIVASNRVSVADGQRLPFGSGSFSYVTNLGSLEHFASPERGLREARRVLRQDGRLALLLPNSHYLLDIIWHVWRRGYPVSHHQEIERFGTAGEWGDLIKQNGFWIEATYRYNLRFPQTRSDWKWYFRWPRKLLYPLLSPLTPFHLSYSFLYLCRPN